MLLQNKEKKNDKDRYVCVVINCFTIIQAFLISIGSTESNRLCNLQSTLTHRYILSSQFLTLLLHYLEKHSYHFWKQPPPNAQDGATIGCEPTHKKKTVPMLVPNRSLTLEVLTAENNFQFTLIKIFVFWRNERRYCSVFLYLEGCVHRWGRCIHN